jgi:hypothetical protein
MNMAYKKNQGLTVKSGKCDLIEGILIGEEVQTKGLSRNKQENTPDMMIKRFTALVRNSGCKETKTKAERAIEALSLLAPGNAVPTSERMRILKEVINPLPVLVTA